MIRQDVIFEIGCEELPSFSVLILAEALAANIKAILLEQQLKFVDIVFYGTPRRLAVLIKEVSEYQEEQHVIKLGPTKEAAFTHDAKPTQALIGFCRANNLALEQVTLQQHGNTERVMLEKHIAGEAAITLLPKCFQQAMVNLPIAKLMHWGNNIGPFVRPVHWILSLYGAQLISGEYFNIKADRMTKGHRYHFPENYQLDNASDYENFLINLKVIPSFAKRRSIILEKVTQQAAAYNATAVIDQNLLDEITAIVEWPVIAIGKFAERFLQLPEEVLIASMQQHQKCFAIRSNDGKLKPNFIAILNIDSKNVATVITGNEKVICARLSDAEFFFKNDQKEPFTALIPKLETIMFHAKLGSLAEQNNRLETLLPEFCVSLKINLDEAKQAILLSKLDLMTGMVQEFPELEGVMGYYYAKLSGEKDALAIALKEQYLPRFAKDELPSTRLGLLLSLLNRLYTLIGIFGIGEKPTGMKDPYKLRRHALAIIRLLGTRNFELNLTDCIDKTVKIFPQEMMNATYTSEIKQFILERLPNLFAAKNIEASLVNAVLEVESDNIFDIIKRVEALHAVINDIKPLLGGIKRVQHILKSYANLSLGVVDSKLLVEPAEIELFQSLSNTVTILKDLQDKKSYKEILFLLSGFRPKIDSFFDTVMVLVEDESLKSNRLSLLAQLEATLCCVADLAKC